MIPVFSLTRQNKTLTKSYRKVFEKVLSGGKYILGPHVTKFEAEFAEYLGVKYAVGVASGTDALTIGLLSLGLIPGDEVILPANSYPTVFGITAGGLVPKLVDIDPVTFNIDPQKIEKAITKKTKAIVAVHMYGQPADMESIMAIGRRNNIPVVEDCAQAHGAEIRIKYNVSGIKNNKEKILNTTYVRRYTEKTLNEQYNLPSKKAGSIGDIGCFSFYPTKNLGCFGDGGMVVTNNPEIAQRVKLLRMYGEKSRYVSVLVGRNSRLDEFQAALLRVKLKHLDGWNEKRREIEALYNVQCSMINDQCYDLQLPFEVSYAKHVYHLYVIRSKFRDELKAYLEKKGIQTGIHYPQPIHLVPSFKYLGYKKGDFPESEKASCEVLSLPMYPELISSEVKKVAEEISSFLKLKND